MLKFLAAERRSPNDPATEVALTDHVLCDRRQCGCRKLFVRLSSRLAVEVAEVVEQDITVTEYRSAFRLSIAGRSHHEADQQADQQADQWLAVAARWPVGTAFLLRGPDLLVHNMPKDYAIRLRLETGAANVTVHGQRDARSAVAAARAAKNAPAAAVVWVTRRPTCDYCDRPGTRYVRDGTVTPLCRDCARDHYGTNIKAETGQLGVTRFDEVNPAEWTDTVPDSYLNSSNYEWVLEPFCAEDAHAVLADLLARQYERDGRGVDDAEIEHALQAADVNQLLAAVLTEHGDDQPLRVVDRFIDQLTRLALPAVSRSDELTIILLGAQGLSNRAVGTPAQCLDTSMTWYYG